MQSHIYCKQPHCKTLLGKPSSASNVHCSICTRSNLFVFSV
ncbi:hypothetical protein [Pseudoalteromonas sp.]